VFVSGQFETGRQKESLLVPADSKRIHNIKVHCNEEGWVKSQNEVQVLESQRPTNHNLIKKIGIFLISRRSYFSGSQVDKGNGL
jgi:hypothetical protein